MLCPLATRKHCLIHETEFKMRSKCPKCGYNHPQRTCPAAGKECKKCGKVGHFAKVYWSKQVLTINSGHEIRKSEPSSSETFFVSSVDIHHKELDWIEKLTLPNGNSFYFKLDTRAQCIILSSLINQRALLTIRPSKTKALVSFSKDRVLVLGEVDVKVFTNQNRPHTVTFLIADNGHQCILGREMCENLGFIKCLKDFAYDIDLIDQPNLHIYPPRRVPYSNREKVKEELD
ncbi:hypothetical protein PR048_016513, partial [Dryococelus australis]